MTPEEEARQEIDTLLEAAGWQVQDYKNLNLGAALGVAIREFQLESGRADYLLLLIELRSVSSRQNLWGPFWLM
jgi:type I restriction enzyme, R subunit